MRNGSYDCHAHGQLALGGRRRAEVERTAFPQIYSAVTRRRHIYTYSLPRWRSAQSTRPPHVLTSRNPSHPQVMKAPRTT
ncbi:hypothetical protein BV25DRAFT_1679828 [Artomyces pyxidatus]|uniref:Uncharacterized protein n=1 Tax=Artomyces pyxidatus TaxID=48021 RepID=A0ACB8TB45_9AGAM|nr:hypothetical protein BV25DRAFT_1679828 [Artomyces pyxidatus]